MGIESWLVQKQHRKTLALVGQAGLEQGHCFTVELLLLFHVFDAKKKTVHAISLCPVVP